MPIYDSNLTPRYIFKKNKYLWPLEGIHDMCINIFLH